jgi:hypothetical protein
MATINIEIKNLTPAEFHGVSYMAEQMIPKLLSQVIHLARTDEELTSFDYKTTTVPYDRVVKTFTFDMREEVKKDV